MKLNPGAIMVVLSGGQDSTICLAWALETFEHVHCVTFDYGQRHRREIEASVKVVEHYISKLSRAISHEVVKLGDHILSSTSPLVSSNELETYANHADMEKIIGNRVETTFVPLRNPLFFVLAANRAVAAGCSSIVSGVCQADNANYPDCRRAFVGRQEYAINLALGISDFSFKIYTPLMDMSKEESIKWAMELPAAYSALAWSHTAYDGQYPPIGNDHASVLRAHGFEQAGVPDPLVMRAHFVDGLMDLPTTDNYTLAAQKMALDTAKEY